MTHPPLSMSARINSDNPIVCPLIRSTTNVGSLPGLVEHTPALFSSVARVSTPFPAPLLAASSSASLPGVPSGALGSFFSPSRCVSSASARCDAASMGNGGSPSTSGAASFLAKSCADESSRELAARSPLSPKADAASPTSSVRATNWQTQRVGDPFRSSACVGNRSRRRTKEDFRSWVGADSAVELSGVLSSEACF